MSLPPTPPISILSHACNVSITGSNITAVNGDVYNYSSGNSNDNEVYYVIRPLCLPDPKPQGYYLVGRKQKDNNHEERFVLRRFQEEKDRDRFVVMLEKFGWAPFVMRKLWELTLNGDPGLIVSSAPVYTWKEMIQKASMPRRIMQLRLMLKIGAAFAETQVVQPGDWNWGDLWAGKWEYKDLRLFDFNGNLVLNPEEIVYHGLAYEESTKLEKQSARGSWHLLSELQSRLGRRDRMFLQQLIQEDMLSRNILDSSSSWFLSWFEEFFFSRSWEELSWFLDLFWESWDSEDEYDESRFEEVSDSETESESIIQASSSAMDIDTTQSCYIPDSDEYINVASRPMEDHSNVVNYNAIQRNSFYHLITLSTDPSDMSAGDLLLVD